MLHAVFKAFFKTRRREGHAVEHAVVEASPFCKEVEAALRILGFRREVWDPPVYRSLKDVAWKWRKMSGGVPAYVCVEGCIYMSLAVEFPLTISVECCRDWAEAYLAPCGVVKTGLRSVEEVLHAVEKLHAVARDVAARIREVAGLLHEMGLEDVHVLADGTVAGRAVLGGRARGEVVVSANPLRGTATVTGRVEWEGDLDALEAMRSLVNKLLSIDRGE